jgi:small multidrug resistance family-3 protein
MHKSISSAIFLLFTNTFYSSRRLTQILPKRFLPRRDEFNARKLNYYFLGRLLNESLLTNRNVISSNKILISIIFFLLAGMCEIGGGYLVWLWLRDGMSWMLGVLGGFVLFAYGIVPTFQPHHFHRIYATYGGIFIVMALLWGWFIEGIRPDIFDITGAIVSLIGVVIIYYIPRKNELIPSEGK